MRRRGDQVQITSGKYTGHQGTIESNVYQRTVDYPYKWKNGYQIMLDTEVLVTVRWEQVESVKSWASLFANELRNNCVKNAAILTRSQAFS